MVSQFRHHLNTDPQFEELRESYPGASRRIRQSRRNNAPNEVLADGDGMDDEMGDEDNDFDEYNASQLGPNGQEDEHNQVAMTDADVQLNGHPPQFAQTIPPPPPLHAPIHAVPGAAQVPAQNFFPDSNQLGPLGFSSFLNNQTAQGQPPLSAHGYAQASMASIGAPGQQPNGARVNGASTASMHHQQPALEEEPDDQSNQHQ